MTRLGGSISLRLSVGFMLVLAVFGMALLVTLYNFEKVTDASEQVRVRQEIRRQVAGVGKLAGQLYACQREFVEAPDFDGIKVSQFLEVHRRIEESLHSLLSRPVDEPERGYLEELGRAATQMRAVFLNKAMVTKLRASMGMVPPLAFDQVQAETAAVLDGMAELTDRLSEAFEIRTLDAEAQARTAWIVSLTITKSVFPIALVMSLLIIYYTHRSIVRPVASLLDGTRALAEGDLRARIEVASSGEFQAVAQSFNQMARALETNQKDLIEAEKMASVGRLAAGIAHEINNPIAVILGYTKMLLSALPDEDAAKEQIQTVDQEARQCKSIVDGLLDLSRPSDPTKGEVLNPNDVVAEVLNIAQAVQLTETVRVEDRVLDKPLPLTISRGRMRQLLLNIIRNGLEVLQKSPDACLKVEGYVRPRAKVREHLLRDASPDAASFLVLVIADNGPGISKADLQRLFEPFFTTKAAGMGLGLAIAGNIARAHGGFIGVESQLGEGTTFTVGLPLAVPT